MTGDGNNVSRTDTHQNERHPFVNKPGRGLKSGTREAETMQWSKEGENRRHWLTHTHCTDKRTRFLATRAAFFFARCFIFKKDLPCFSRWLCYVVGRAETDWGMLRKEGRMEDDLGAAAVESMFDHASCEARIRQRAR